MTPYRRPSRKVIHQLIVVAHIEEEGTDTLRYDLMISNCQPVSNIFPSQSVAI